MIVGQHERQTILYSGAFADLSESLRKFISDIPTVYEGDDTTSGDWRHVDLDTFIRFCEFAYRGDTTSPVQ
jgi:hypothetical protein